MKSLIAAATILTLLLLTVMLGKNKKLTADRYLITYLIFAVLSQGYMYVESTGLLQQSVWMLLGKGIFLLQTPFFFLYVLALTEIHKPSGKIYALLFSPFIMYLIHFLYYYFFVFDNVQLVITRGLLHINGEISLPWLLFVVVFMAIDPIYLVWFYILLKRYKARWEESISNSHNLQLRWLNVLFYVWLAGALLLIPVSLSVVTNEWFSAESLQVLIEVANVTFLFVLGYYGFRQTTVFTNLALIESSGNVPRPNYERSGLTAERAREYHTRLLEIMEKEKPYLFGELNAAELASKVGISVNHLSNVLNKEQKQNFFEFVNSYRVNEVIRRMNAPDTKNLTLLAIAIDSGFNSKTSFNTIFKRVTGSTPSQYYKNKVKAD